MKQLIKADIFNPKWPRPVKVEVPELGGYAFVRILSAGDVERVEQAGIRMTDAGAQPNVLGQRGLLVALCACDEGGVRLFSDDDAEELSRKPGVMIDRLASAAAEANHLRGKAREEVRKNSSTAPA